MIVLLFSDFPVQQYLIQLATGVGRLCVLAGMGAGFYLLRARKPVRLCPELLSVFDYTPGKWSIVEGGGGRRW